MTIIEIISLSVFSIGIMFYSFIKGYSYGKSKEKQKYEQEYIQKTKDLEIYFLKRGYCIACCRFDVCPNGEDNTCKGCNLYDECYTENVPSYREPELKN